MKMLSTTTFAALLVAFLGIGQNASATRS